MVTEPAQSRYLSERYEGQRRYYAGKAAWHKRWHQGLQTFVALGAVGVPVLLGIGRVPTIVPTVLSALVAAATALENVYHFGDNWRLFRRTAEALQREKELFDTGAGPYLLGERTAFQRFVERVEGALETEQREFVEAVRPRKPGA